MAWSVRGGPGPTRSRILPDGAMDLLWDGAALRVAGPDATARWHEDPGGTAWTALRFTGGAGPAVLGVPADALTGQTVPLDALLPGPEVRRLAEELAGAEQAADDARDARDALVGWTRHRIRAQHPDPLGPALAAMATDGLAVSAMADALGFSSRQLQRRSHRLFGYGPQHLRRVLRLQRLLGPLDAGVGLARIAAEVGLADQAHLAREVAALTGTSPSALRAERVGGRPGEGTPVPAVQPSGANRSTGVPSGSRSTA